MSRPIVSALVILVILGTAVPVAATESEPPTTPVAGEVVPGEVVVKWREREAREGTVLAAERGLATVSELAAPNGQRPPEVLSTGGRTVEAVLADLRADPAVEYAEPNYVVRLSATIVNDPKTRDQYSLDRMRVRDAWDITRGGSGVVAVLDTGVMATHRDLSGRVLAGYDFVNDDTNAADDNGHGTWVAGIIAAKPNDGYGIAGISWTDRILPVKIMNREGTGTTSDLTSGITWAANHGATVINMSVGGFPYAQYVQDAINYAWGKGAVLVGAAGNNRREERFYPASYTNVVSVSATQLNDEFSHWSSYGPAVDVSAPGSSVLTTNCEACAHGDPGEHTYISGTSFATPNVAGVVALIRAKFPTEGPAQIVARLIQTSDDLGYPGWDNRYGQGRVNAWRAVGGAPPLTSPSTGDAMEPNNALASARVIALGATARPSLHPAGDVDVFAVDVPRAGRLDVRVTGVVDSRAWPWSGSSLKVDPIVELWTTSGSLIRRVDDVWETGTELASASTGGPQRILVRVVNYFANGNTSAYSVTPTFVDTVPPSVVARSPAAGATGVGHLPTAVARYSEPVKNVTASTIRIRDTVTNLIVPATVTYDAASREARVAVSQRLQPARIYQVEATSAITDAVGRPATAATWRFTTGISGFADTAGSGFEWDIRWLSMTGITSGCAVDRFCPLTAVSREQMASFLARGLSLPAATRDYFSDDETSAHEPDINRVARAGVTGGCAAGRYCPRGTVTREQMASFLVRALKLPPAARDYFTDDETSPHEADINRLAASGITGGCSATAFCPKTVVSREQMAAFLHRALGD